MYNRVLARLKPEARAFLRKHSDVRELCAGQVIYEHGEPIAHAIFPSGSIISIIARMQDGRSVEKSSIGNEGFIGLSVILGGTTAFGRYVVQVPGPAHFIEREPLDEALDRFHCIRQAMLQYAKAHTLQLMESVACNSLHTAEQRIVRWLLHAHDRIGADTFYITQEALSNLLALRRATVNAVCSELMQAGAIHYNRGTLTVADRELLNGRACECYGRIREAALGRVEADAVGR